MIPYFSSANHADKGFANTEGQGDFSQLLSSDTSNSYLANSIIGELCSNMTFATHEIFRMSTSMVSITTHHFFRMQAGTVLVSGDGDLSSFDVSVFHVLRMRTKPQVSGIATRRVVATMQDAESIWYVAIGETENNAVGAVEFTRLP